MHMYVCTCTHVYVHVYTSSACQLSRGNCHTSMQQSATRCDTLQQHTLRLTIASIAPQLCCGLWVGCLFTHTHAGDSMSTNSVISPKKRPITNGSFAKRALYQSFPPKLIVGQRTALHCNNTPQEHTATTHHKNTLQQYTLQHTATHDFVPVLLWVEVYLLLFGYLLSLSSSVRYRLDTSVRY